MRVSVSSCRGWDVATAILLSRRPLQAPPLTSIEEDFQKILASREEKRSLLCDFELKSIQDEKLEAKRKELLEAGREMSELEGELGVSNSMRIEEWNKRDATLSVALQTSSHSPSLQSLTRLPNRHLFLIVKQRFGSAAYSSPWILPQAKHVEGESLRQTAERCLSSSLPGVSSSGFSNAPFAVHSFKYPKPLKLKLETSNIGAKIFFFSTELQSDRGTMEVDKKEISDLQWCALEELSIQIKDTKYRNALTAAIVQ